MLLDLGSSVNILSKELYDSYLPWIRETSECTGKSTSGSVHASCILSHFVSVQSSPSDTTGAGLGAASRGDSPNSTQSSIDASHNAVRGIEHAAADDTRHGPARGTRRGTAVSPTGSWVLIRDTSILHHYFVS
jgi:hypothetical protein